jgi:hypothetical protein
MPFRTAAPTVMTEMLPEPQRPTRLHALLAFPAGTTDDRCRLRATTSFSALPR